MSVAAHLDAGFRVKFAPWAVNNVRLPPALGRFAVTRGCHYNVSLQNGGWHPSNPHQAANTSSLEGAFFSTLFFSLSPRVLASLREDPVEALSARAAFLFSFFSASSPDSGRTGGTWIWKLGTWNLGLPTTRIAKTRAGHSSRSKKDE